MVGSADAGNGIGGTVDKVKVLASCAIANSSITSAHIVDGAILNVDINASAAIALSKLAIDPVARANHTATQAASTISDFDTEVANNTAVTANTAKISYCSTASNAVAANTAKISYCSTASTKLGTIETCANNYTHTTNANLTGDVTSIGNATTIASGITISNPTLTFAINAQTGTTYTPILADAGKIITLNNGSAIAVTIPPNSGVAYAIGSSLTFISIGAGLTTIGQGAGVTIASAGGTATAPIITAQHNSATAIKIATDTWQVIGALT